VLECLDASLANAPKGGDNIVGTGKYYSLDDILEIGHFICPIASEPLRRATVPTALTKDRGVGYVRSF